jgi:hypothetical protein
MCELLGISVTFNISILHPFTSVYVPLAVYVIILYGQVYESQAVIVDVCEMLDVIVNKRDKVCVHPTAFNDVFV